MKKIKNKKIIVICVILVFLVIALIILNILKKVQNEQKLNSEMLERINSYTSVNDFKTIEEVAMYLECEFIKQEKSKNEDYDIDIYMKIKEKPYTNNQSNEGLYNKLISYSARVLNYKNFRIIDKKNDITIQIMCNKDDKKIVSKMINGETEYFAKHDSYLEIEQMNDTNITKLNVQSNVLKKLISNNWREQEINLGTKESTFEQYDIYFDEGIQVRKVNNKVFNIIFTEKYKENIVNNINTTTSKESIIKILGKPTYENEEYNLIGYKSNDIYFFYNKEKQISIYRVEKDYDSKEFAKIVDSYLEKKDQSQLIKDLKKAYTDFDKYENNANGEILQYTLKGIMIRFKKGSSRGVHIFNNYTGTIYKDITLSKIKENTELPDNVFIKDEDLVLKNEISRIEKINTMRENASIEKTNDPKETQSSKYYTVKTKLDGDTYKVEFISIDGSNPNSELKENVDSYIWVNDDNFVYSVKNKGIYIYNLSSRKYGTIKTGNEEFKIIEYKDKVLKYDKNSIKFD